MTTPLDLTERRMKSVVRNITDVSAPVPTLPVLALQDLQAHTGRVLPTHADRRVDGNVKLCESGDVVFGKLRPYLAKAATVRHPMAVVSEFLVLRPGPDIVAEYLEYILRSAPFIHRVTALTSGAKMPRVEWSTLGHLPIALPEVHDQSLLVRYMQHAEMAVTRALETKRSLISLLDERRRAVTQILVTSGMASASDHRSSGIPWLGEVPGSWDVRPAKWFYREVNERSERGEEQLMSVSHITGVTPRAEKNITMFMAASYAGHKLCRPGDLVVNTMWAWMGALGIALHTGIVSPAYGVYRPLPTSLLLPDYANLLLRSRPYIDEYTCRSTGIRSSRLRLYPDRFLTIPIVCPPAAEQREIVDSVAEVTGELDAAIAGTLREIELLQEYRARLIADVVTGIRDVRAEAESLPEFDPAELAAVLATGMGADEGLDEEAEEVADAV